MSAREFRWPFRAAGKALGSDVVDAAWLEYRATGSESARDTLVQRYLHLVRYMAVRLGRTLPSTVDGEDLVSAGIVGFLGALDSFDPDMGTEFSGYALIRIRGAIVDFTRESDPIGRVTRRRLRQAARVLTELEQALGREPSDAEAAEKLEMSLDDYHELIGRAIAALTLSLEGVEGAGDDETDRASYARVADLSTKDPLTDAVDKEASERLTALVARLPRAQQLVLHLHYVETLRFREIAMVMDISESRANQLHSTALVVLRGRLEQRGVTRAA